MIERDEFEDVLSGFRPVGPRAEMQPPAELSGVVRAQRGPVRRVWVAGGILFGVVLIGGTLWMTRPDSHGEAVEGAAHARTPADARGYRRSSQARGEQRIPVGRREDPVVVGRFIPAPARTNTVVPTYSTDPGPGLVANLELTVDPQGAVQGVTITDPARGVSAYEAAAAARQWTYEPLRLNGEPVWFITRVTVTHPWRDVPAAGFGRGGDRAWPERGWSGGRGRAR